MMSLNLSGIARTVEHGTGIDSKRGRLKRFFARSGMELDNISTMVVDWMVPEGNWVVCLDRTNRDFGDGNFAGTREKFVAFAAPDENRQVLADYIGQTTKEKGQVVPSANNN
ncbi:MULTISPECIES: hypothetical protein [unclassified Endozoicomonas]|uniref:hypothetical protein n=1 Tax=unclassified Endozoicomonas TaxID=2644528 RepID=UPI00214730C0|nr:MULTISPECIES: hypothetical protein [unclassified Endozoicomonas]